MAYSRIVVGVDGSGTASHALQEAARLAEAQGAELLIVSAYEPPDPKQVARWQSESPGEMSWKFTGTALVEEVLKKAEKDATKILPKVRTVYQEGDPAESLIEVAESEEADLIVVGNKGMAGAKRFLLGSVPNKVSHHAPCDVIIIKTT